MSTSEFGWRIVKISFIRFYYHSVINQTGEREREGGGGGGGVREGGREKEGKARKEEIEKG